MKKKCFLIWLCLLLWYFLPVAPVQAQSSASSSALPYRSEVTAEFVFPQAGTPKATLDFKLTNTGPTQYVSEYHFGVPLADVQGLVLLPKQQKINKTETTTDGVTWLGLEFTNEVVGQGKSREFALEFNPTNLQTIRGQTQYLQIPALVEADSYSKYQTSLIIPTAWGTPATLTPNPEKIATTAGQVTYTFNQRQGETIEFIFGHEQYLQWHYQATLVNQSNSPAYQELIFPGNQAEVELIYAELEPKPDRWQELPDGNFAGYYLLKIGASLPVTAGGYLIYRQAAVDFIPQEYYPYLPGNFTVETIAQLPETVFLEDYRDQIQTTIELRRLGFWPQLNSYNLLVHNLTGRRLQHLQLSATVSANLQVKLSRNDVTLLPFEKTAIIAQVSRPGVFGSFYQDLEFTASLDYLGTRIHETNTSGLYFAYSSAALVGGIFAATITTGSLLVARWRQKSSLRRQSQKS